MRSVRAWLLRLAAGFGADRRDRELSAELESHLQLHIDDNLRAGMTPAEARRQAVIALGGVEQTKERYRDRRGIPQIEHFLQDLRFGLRMWRRNPAFTVVSIIILAVGIAANVLIFGVASEMLLRPLPLPNPDRLVRVYSDRFSNTVYADYLAYRDATRSLSGLGAFALTSISIRTSSEPERVTGMAVSGNYFETIGLQPARGRVFTAADDRSGAPGVAFLSDRAWRQRFAADPAIVGRQITINGQSFTIIGVAGSGYRGEMAPFAPELWVPWNAPGFAPTPADVAARRGRSAHMVGRLRPGFSPGQAQAELSTIAGTFASAAQDAVPRRTATVYPADRLMPEIGGTVSLFAGFLLALVLLVLAIACGNIANLLLARWSARRREIAVRLAIGAGRGRIVSQLLTEGLLLSLFGATAGLGLTAVAGRAIAGQSLATPEGPVSIEFGFDWRVALFASAVMVLTTIVFGLLPAMQSSKAPVQPALKDGCVAGGAARSRLRTMLVTGQVSLSALLLVTAALLGRSLFTAMTTDRGFVTEGVLAATIDLGVLGYAPDRGMALYDQLLRRIEQTPGVQAATLLDIVPLTLSNRAGVLLKEGEELRADGPRPESVNLNVVTRGHFQTLSIAVLAGRDFDQNDGSAAAPVAIVNETLARRYWPGDNPLGKRVRFAQSRTTFGPWLEVVGLARDSKYVSVGEDSRAFVYRPLAQQYVSRATVLVKSDGEPMSMLPAVRTHLRELDPHLPLFNAGPLEAATNLSLIPVQVASVLAALVGIVALALAALGIYGVTSYLIQQRTREIGIRLALGAQPSQVMGLITRQGMRWMATGLLIGLTIALAAARMLTALLYGVAPTDPLAFGGVTIVLAATAYAACRIPAYRLSRLNPLAALHEE